MHFVIPHRWRRQPQVPVGIDWNNPLSKGLLAAVLPERGPAIRNLVDGKFCTVTTDSATLGMRHIGRVFQHNSSVSAYDIALPRTIPSGTSARYSFGYFGGWNEGPNDICFLTPSDQVELRTEWPNLGGLRHWGGGTYRDIAVPNSENGAAFAAGYDGTNNWRVTAASNATNAETGLNGEVSTLRLRLSWDSQGINAWTGLLALWDVSLPEVLAREFCDNPWQIFRPLKRRIYVGEAVGGGGGGGSTRRRFLPALGVA